LIKVQWAKGGMLFALFAKAFSLKIYWILSEGFGFYLSLTLPCGKNRKEAKPKGFVPLSPHLSPKADCKPSDARAAIRTSADGDYSRFR